MHLTHGLSAVQAWHEQRGNAGNASFNNNSLIYPKIAYRLFICFAQAFPWKFLFFNYFRKKRLRWRACCWATVVLIMEPWGWEEVGSAFWPFHFPTGSSPKQRQLLDSSLPETAVLV